MILSPAFPRTARFPLARLDYSSKRMPEAGVKRISSCGELCSTVRYFVSIVSGSIPNIRNISDYFQNSTSRSQMCIGRNPRQTDIPFCPIPPARHFGQCDRELMRVIPNTDAKVCILYSEQRPIKYWILESVGDSTSGLVTAGPKVTLLTCGFHTRTKAYAGFISPTRGGVLWHGQTSEPRR